MESKVLVCRVSAHMCMCVCVCGIQIMLITHKAFVGCHKVQLRPDVVYGLVRGDFEGRTKLTRSIRK